jgi:hypothetical protein
MCGRTAPACAQDDAGPEPLAASRIADVIRVIHTIFDVNLAADRRPRVIGFGRLARRDLCPMLRGRAQILSIG